MVSLASTWLSVFTSCVICIVTSKRLAQASSQVPTNRQCNFTLSISSSLTLQQVVTSVSNDHGTGFNCIRIEVHSGIHALTSQILFPAEVGEIEFVGLESDVTVICSYNVGYQNYTWYFDHLSSVTIRGIHFKSCPRPLRLDTISNVTIQNCSFRYKYSNILPVCRKEKVKGLQYVSGNSLPCENVLWKCSAYIGRHL